MPKKMWIQELLWFISGSDTVKDLQGDSKKLWRDFADDDGYLGPVYGYQWRKWPDYKGGHIDQLQKVIDEIKNDPNSKGMIVSAWNPAQLNDMRLPPCHTFFQFNVTRGKLRCQLYQRSSDAFLGAPFNIAEYSLLTIVVGVLTGYEPVEFIMSVGDAHIYKNQTEAVKTQLQRKPKPLPKIKLNTNVKKIDDYTIDDFKIVGYEHHPRIDAPVVVI